MAALSFDETPILSYLGIIEKDSNHGPSPTNDPIEFLLLHLHRLPPHLLLKFSLITTPKQRTVIPAIRNRRLKYLNSKPTELSFSSARHTWPTLWPGRERRGAEEGNEEKQWAETEFLQGMTKHVRKIGTLLGGYEEEREAERVRTLRREETVVEQDEFVPEEDDDSDEDDAVDLSTIEEDAEIEKQAEFERLIQDRFIYGLLDRIDYDKVDWDDSLDADNDREMEERWFDEEDED